MGSGPWLLKPASSPATPNKVDDTYFYVVTGMAPDVTKWFESHPPTGSRLSGTGLETSHGKPRLWSADFDWPGVHNVLFSEEVVIGVATLPGHKAGVRVDSQVTWLPGRSPLDTVPAGSTAVDVIVAVPNGSGAPGMLLEPTITTVDPAVIGKIMRDVDALQVLLPGPYACPPGPNLEIYVEFLRSEAGTPDAITKAYPYGCAFVRMQVLGHTSPQILVNGAVLTSQLKHLVGLKLPPVSQPAIQQG